MDGIVERKLSWNEVLGRTYSLYAEHFATFLKIAFLPAVIAWVWRYGYAAAFRQAVASGWLDRRNFPTMTALELMQGSVYWIISAFFLAAVAAQVLCEPGDQSSLSDAFTAARDRMGAVLGVTLLTWLLYYVGRTISAIAIAELFRGSVLFRNYWATTITFSIPLLLVAGLLSRFGLAIPALMTQPELRVTQALKESMALTESWEPFHDVSGQVCCARLCRLLGCEFPAASVLDSWLAHTGDLSVGAIDALHRHCNGGGDAVVYLVLRALWRSTGDGRKRIECSGDWVRHRRRHRNRTTNRGVVMTQSGSKRA